MELDSRRHSEPTRQQKSVITVYASHIFLRKGTRWKNLAFVHMHNADSGKMLSRDLKPRDLKIEFNHRRLVTILNSPFSATIRN